jgi:RNA polymerase sigma factor (sigma-70 family)
MRIAENSGERMTECAARSDGELLGDFAVTGSENAFGELVRRHGRMVHAVCRRVLSDPHEAEDVAQAAFLTLARKARELRNDSSVSGWLHRVAWCLARNTRKARERRRRHEESAMGEATDQIDSPADTVGLRAEIDAAVDALPERFRRAVVLFHLEERSAEETATALGLNPGALRMRLVRAREMLRKKLVRRGVTVGSVGALTALLSAEAGAAVLPATFVSATVKAAGLAAAGELAAGVGTGVVSANVAALTKGACNMLFIAKVQTAVLTAAACLVVAGTGVVAAKQLAGSSTSAVTVAHAVNRDPNPEAHAAKLEDLPATLKDMTVDERMLYLKRYAQQFKPRHGVAVQRSANGAVEVAVAAENTPIKLWRPTGTVLSVVVAGDGTTSTLQAREGGEVHLAAMPPSGDVYALGGDGSPVGANGGAGGGAGGVVRAGTKPSYDPPFDHFQDVDMNKANPRRGGGRGMAVAFFAVNPVPATQVGPEAPEELPRKEAIDEIRRQLATGRAGHKLPDSFKVEIELNAVGRSVGLREHWVFTPQTVSRLAYMKRGEKRVQEPVATNEFTKIKELCDALWNGEFLQLAGAGEWICGRGGSGPFFYGTPFIGGEQRITVSVRDHKLALGRSCWHATRDNDSDRESQFAGLYNSIKGLAPNPNAAIAAAMTQGVKTGVVPAGFDVVIETFGSKADSEKRERLDKIVSEAWRFGPAKVETFTANTVERSREVNEMKAVCQALVAAGFMTLAEAPRGEPFAGALTFDTVPCKYGWRYVRVSLDNQTLYLGEGTTWPAFTDAKQAEQARALYVALRKIAQAE